MSKTKGWKKPSDSFINGQIRQFAKDVAESFNQEGKTGGHGGGGRRARKQGEHRKRVKAAWTAKVTLLESLLEKIGELDAEFSDDRSRQGHSLVIYDVGAVFSSPNRFRISTLVTNRNILLAQKDLERAKKEHFRRTFAKNNPELYAKIVLDSMDVNTRLLFRIQSMPPEVSNTGNKAVDDLCNALTAGQQSRKIEDVNLSRSELAKVDLAINSYLFTKDPK